MSSPKLNLNMLSPFLLGEEISTHDGVTCFPAIRRGTDEKYIVKVISIPASQSKVDALLLTGALSGKEAALEYFMTLSKDILRQTDILRSLSQQEGFVPYLDGQIQQMEGDVGYHVYLLGTYKQSLERILRSDAMTHADVANLGLDLCAALAACRRTGYLYADLKPGNIFRDEEQGFRIGDVGFIALSSLKYASLPDKYRSSYTAPELSDDMAVLNHTVDIYALGLVLYQAYNGGTLPFTGAAPGEVLPPPMYADYEMADIILKACHPDPKERWQDPTKMAHALIEYLQTYGAPETPIIPPPMDRPEEEEEIQEEPFEPEADAQQLQKEIEDLENADPDELAFLSGLSCDETAPNEENTADVPDDVMTEELSLMLAQADELIDHELPPPPVAPEPVFAPMPEPIVLEEPEALIAEEEIEEQLTPEEVPQTEDPAPLPQICEPAEETPEEPQVIVPAEPEGKTQDTVEAQPRQIPAIVWRIVAVVAAVLVLMGTWLLGQRYYKEEYLLKVDGLVLHGDKDTLTVQVLSDIDESLLRVVCTDSYGNSTTSAVSSGFATFTQLRPGTRYTVKVEVSGNHKLTGKLSDSFSTPAQTQILSFIAGIGPEDRSVALNFTVSGPESNTWTIVYSADGIAEQSHTFTGRSTVIEDLVAGAHYTFTLTSPDGLYMAGHTQTEYTATNILYAKDLTITDCGGGSLRVQWQQPDEGNVTAWRVRCFNESGYNVTITTQDLSHTFTGLDHSTPCTVEVTAVGMNKSVSTSISAEPVTVVDFTCDITEFHTLLLEWVYTGTTPANGWLLCYSVDGTQYTLPLSEPVAQLMAIPGGSYEFTIQTADGNFVFNSTHSYQAAEITHFANYGIAHSDLTAMPILLPEGDKWKPTDLGSDDYRNLFVAGDKAAILITSGLQPDKSENPVRVNIVICDSNGQVVSHSTEDVIWDELWYKNVCVLPIAELPQDGGDYIVQVFFDGALVYGQEITVDVIVPEGGTQEEPAH